MFSFQVSIDLFIVLIFSYNTRILTVLFLAYDIYSIIEGIKSSLKDFSVIVNFTTMEKIR